MLLSIMPGFIRAYTRLIALKLRHRDCTIASPWIHRTARIGQNCAVLREARIGGGVILGDFSYVNVGAMVASGSIGKYCSIGYYAKIGVAEHPTNYVSTSPWTYGRGNVFGLPPFWHEYSAPPVIGNDVWIGANALVLQGVTVGDGAIVCGGATVTRDVAPYMIVAGIPAKPLRPRFDQDCIEQLLKLKWWDLDTTTLLKLSSWFQMKDNAIHQMDCIDYLLR